MTATHSWSLVSLLPAVSYWTLVWLCLDFLSLFFSDLCVLELSAQSVLPCLRFVCLLVPSCLRTALSGAWTLCSLASAKSLGSGCWFRLFSGCQLPAWASPCPWLYFMAYLPFSDCFPSSDLWVAPDLPSISTSSSSAPVLCGLFLCCKACWRSLKVIWKCVKRQELYQTDGLAICTWHFQRPYQRSHDPAEDKRFGEQTGFKTGLEV